jgi:hypothetical protein
MERVIMCFIASGWKRIIQNSECMHMGEACYGVTCKVSRTLGVIKKQRSRHIIF